MVQFIQRSSDKIARAESLLTLLQSHALSNDDLPSPNLEPSHQEQFWACHSPLILNRSHQSLIFVTLPIASSPNILWILRIVWPREAPSLWQNLMQYFCKSFQALNYRVLKTNARNFFKSRTLEIKYDGNFFKSYMYSSNNALYDQNCSYGVAPNWRNGLLL